jgi:hypothetical protein
MRVGLEALDDVQVSTEMKEAVTRKVTERFASSVFSGVQDLRLRLRRTRGALLCVAVVGFAEGDLVTATATSETALEAVVDALDGLPERIERLHRGDRRPAGEPAATNHAAVRRELQRLLARA